MCTRSNIFLRCSCFNTNVFMERWPWEVVYFMTYHTKMVSVLTLCTRWHWVYGLSYVVTHILVYWVYFGRYRFIHDFPTQVIINGVFFIGTNALSIHSKNIENSHYSDTVPFGLVLMCLFNKWLNGIISLNFRKEDGINQINLIFTYLKINSFKVFLSVIFVWRNFSTWHKVKTWFFMLHVNI